jgi:lipoate-protein ligase A
MFDRAAPDGRTVWVVEPTSTAVVLGSTQRPSIVVPGTPVVRRRSGGGAVLVEPDALLWVDAFVPADDALMEDDVGRAFAWLGGAWSAALGDLGIAGAQPHRGPLVDTPWSTLVCFAGLGPGEVTVGGAKVVGMAQRRTRAGALFQSAALLEWRPDRLLDVLAVSDDDRRRGATELADVARPVNVDPGELVAALVERLP